MVSIPASRPSCTGLILSVPEIFSEETSFNVAEVNQRCLEESGQQLENVDRTQLVLTSFFFSSMQRNEAQ